MSDEGQTLQAGTVVGGTYEVLHQIGRGGMGEVWLAKHLRLPKQVAIKVLRGRGGPLSEETLARFRREADIASRLGHPNIAEVHDFNTLPGGAPYLVLEFLEGEPLSRRLQRGPLSLEDARSVVRQVGAALMAAHALGVVHRDLKPDNVFLLPSPLGGLRVKVLDFGISKIADSDTVKTQEAVLVGTPQYMSPEQATGSNKDVGPQTDVFALGVMAYEMLCGQPPFAGESIAQVVFRVAYEQHPPLATRVGPEVPAPVVQAVEKALLKDRAHRTADVGAFVAEFTGQPLTLSAREAVAPQSPLAVMATPSLALRDSVGMGDTEASTPRGLKEPPAKPPPAPAPAPSAADSTSGTKAPLPPGTGRMRVVLTWVSVAASLAVGFAVTSQLRTWDSSDSIAGLDQSEPAVAGPAGPQGQVVAAAPPSPRSVPAAALPTAPVPPQQPGSVAPVPDAGAARLSESPGAVQSASTGRARAKAALTSSDRILLDDVQALVNGCTPGSCNYVNLSELILRRMTDASVPAGRDALHAERARLACHHHAQVDFQTAKSAIQDPTLRRTVRCGALGAEP